MRKMRAGPHGSGQVVIPDTRETPWRGCGPPSIDPAGGKRVPLAVWRGSGRKMERYVHAYNWYIN